MKFLDETFRIPVRGHWEEKETYSSDYLYENEETAFYLRGTVRSGQSLEFPGNIIILGDVNPGAYVIASGDIIVMGRLHGVVHAGAEGEERAVAIGMNFRPSQLRIAQYIARPPDEGPRSRKKRPQAEKAYIKDGVIVIEPLL
ncbi:MAG: septum site-determining protein MinC [bacterium]|nr:septum site-determining protein MinC [bacterium]